MIEGNRIHDCGRIPSTNLDHGIYIESSTDAVIRGNFIYDNVDRGIQLYPDAQGTKISGNVIDGNGEGIIFSGKGGLVSSNTSVTGNVIANSRTRWNLESGGDGPKATGNLVHANCVWSSNPDAYYNEDNGVQPRSKNFAATENLDAKPVYVNRGAGDLRLAPGSGCRRVVGGAPAAEMPEPTTPDSTSAVAPSVTVNGTSTRVVLDIRAGSGGLTAVATGKIRARGRVCTLNACTAPCAAANGRPWSCTPAGAIVTLGSRRR